MGLMQYLGMKAREGREPVTISTVTHTLTLGEIESGSISGTYSSGGQTITVPSEPGPPFFIVAADGTQSVTISGLYGTTTCILTTLQSALVHYIDGYGWFAVSQVAST